MAKKKRIPPEDWAALKAEWAETERKLAERIAYHEAKLEEERRLGLR